MPTHHNIELRSEEIQELLTRVPSSIIRWGITALFFCAALFLTSSYFVKLPDKITGDLLMSDSRRGEIYIPVKNTGMIQNGQKISLRLDNFPSAKFGTIDTVVDSMSYDSDKKKYIVYTPKLDLLETNFGLKLEELPLMEGDASIIIDEKRVIHKILPFLDF